MKGPLELARRRAGGNRAPRALDMLARRAGEREGDAAPPGPPARNAPAAGTAGAAATDTGLPRVWEDGILSFYDLLRRPSAPRRCNGTACRFAEVATAGGDDAADGSVAAAGELAVYCLGRCYEAPVTTRTRAAPIPRRAVAAVPVVLRHLLGDSDPTRTAEAVTHDYDLPDGETILDAVIASGLRGRGGAAYPTGAKWKVARDTPAPDRWVVANGDEGDPGAYVDRLLLEEAPHSVLAGMVACARAIGARHGVVYVRGEYPRAAQCMRRAVAEARECDLLGGFDVEVVTGAGSYVAGEETALLRSIEGLRAEPSCKPPYPAASGLRGLPTIVQNVETLSVIPWVIRNRRPAATKAVCLAGAVANPGVVEIDLGTPLRRVLEEGGGGSPEGSRWKMALVGGPLGRVVGLDDFDVAMSFEALPGMGHAGVVVLEDSVSARALAEHLFEFARRESCGTCTPCRAGCAHLPACDSLAGLERLLDTMEAGSLCGFGQGVPRPIRDLLRLFGAEVVAGAEVPR